MKRYYNRMKPKTVKPPIQSIKKTLWSGITSFIGIFLISLICNKLELLKGSGIFMIGSFGASAVLLYGAPIANYSQPRNVIGGHFISALIGVMISKTISGDIILASALAVSFSIVIMHFTNTVHPPGGATALIAVIGNPTIKQLGFKYAFVPVLLGAVILTVIAIITNNLSRNSKRHYPEYYI